MCTLCISKSYQNHDDQANLYQSQQKKTDIHKILKFKFNWTLINRLDQKLTDLFWI